MGAFLASWMCARVLDLIGVFPLCESSLMKLEAWSVLTWSIGDTHEYGCSGYHEKL